MIIFTTASFRKNESGSAVLFIAITLSAIFLAVAGLNKSIQTIISSQHAQTAADAAALSCVIHGQDSVERTILMNDSELISLNLTISQCQVVAQFRGISRGAFASITGNSDLPTLQR